MSSHAGFVQIALSLWMAAAQAPQPAGELHALKARYQPVFDAAIAAGDWRRVFDTAEDALAAYEAQSPLPAMEAAGVAAIFAVAAMQDPMVARAHGARVGPRVLALLTSTRAPTTPADHLWLARARLHAALLLVFGGTHDEARPQLDQVRMALTNVVTGSVATTAEEAGDCGLLAQLYAEIGDHDAAERVGSMALGLAALPDWSAQAIYRRRADWLTAQGRLREALVAARSAADTAVRAYGCCNDQALEVRLWFHGLLGNTRPTEALDLGVSMIDEFLAKIDIGGRRDTLVRLLFVVTAMSEGIPSALPRLLARIDRAAALLADYSGTDRRLDAVRGTLLAMHGRTSEAIEVLTAVTRSWPSVQSDEAFRAWLALGLAQSTAGQHADAATSMQKSIDYILSVTEFTKADDRTSLSEGAALLASQYAFAGDLSRAYERFLWAAGANADCIPCHLGMALISVRRGEAEAARSSLSSVRRIRVRFTGMFASIAGGDDQLHASIAWTNLLAPLLTVSPELTKASLEGDTLDVLLAGRAGATRAGRRMSRLLQTQQRDPEVRRLAASWRLALARQTRAPSLPQGPPAPATSPGPDPTMIERRLAERLDTLAPTTEARAATWQTIRQTLRGDEAAIEVVRHAMMPRGPRNLNQYGYVAFIVRRTSERPAVVVLGDLVDYESDDAAQSPGSPESRGVRPLRLSARDRATTAGEQFWRAMTPHLAGASRVYLAPDGILQLTPWSMVTTRAGAPLPDTVTLTLVTSISDLGESRPEARGAGAAGRTRRRLAPPSIAVFGNPSFDRAPLNIVGSVGNELAHLRSSGLVTRVSPLPGTQIEVDRLSRLFRAAGWKVDSFEADRASEGALRGLTNPRVLHIATHGFFLAHEDRASERLAVPFGLRPPLEQDSMLRSGLLFAGANHTIDSDAPPSDNDGVLTAAEAQSLQLEGAELVTLSACSTALGSLAVGEGLLGLRRAFDIAGARAMLVSLWDVPDRQTATLMERFYRNWLRGQDKAAALWAAQKSIRDENRAANRGDRPEDWAAFVLYGR